MSGTPSSEVINDRDGARKKTEALVETAKPPTLEDALNHFRSFLGRDFYIQAEEDFFDPQAVQAAYEDALTNTLQPDRPFEVASLIMRWAVRKFGALRTKERDYVIELVNLAANRWDESKQVRNAQMARVLAASIVAWYSGVEQLVRESEAKTEAIKDHETTGFYFNGFFYSTQTNQPMAPGTIIRIPADESALSITATRPEVSHIWQTVFVKVVSTKPPRIDQGAGIDAVVEVEQVNVEKDTFDYPIARVVN